MGMERADPFGERAGEIAERLRSLIFSEQKAPAVERVNGEAKDFHAYFPAGQRCPTVLEAADVYYTERETKRDFSEKKRNFPAKKVKKLLKKHRLVLFTI